MRVLHDIFQNVLADYYMPAVVIVALLGAITTSEWFFCRLCHGSIDNLYRWATVWPPIMWLVSLWTTGQIGHQHQSARYLSPVIALAFGFGFSASLFRVRSWLYYALGILFILLFIRVTRYWHFESSVYITA